FQYPHLIQKHELMEVEERRRLEEEKVRVQSKDKTQQSANASAEVKSHLKNFITRKWAKEGKPSSELDMLRRYQSEPVLNPRLESGSYKIKSEIRQRLLTHHRHSPINSSDKRHSRSTKSSNSLQETNLSNKNHHKLYPSVVLPRTESDDITHYQNNTADFLLGVNGINLHRSPYSCSTGCIGKAQKNSVRARLGRMSDISTSRESSEWQHEAFIEYHLPLRLALSWSTLSFKVSDEKLTAGKIEEYRFFFIFLQDVIRNNFTNILGRKYFIVEEEDEALLTKELQEAKIQSTNNSRNSIHNSHPQIFHSDLHTCLPNAESTTFPIERLVLHSKSLSSLPSLLPATSAKRLQKSSSQTISMRYTTVYDDVSLEHECYCKRTDIHLENPRRLLVIYEHLRNSNLLEDCEIIRGRCATMEMLTDCHNHAYLFGCDLRQRAQQPAAFIEECRQNIVKLPCGGYGVKDDTDTVWNEEYTARVCRLAVGNTIELATLVWNGKLKNGFSLVRPPGHHAGEKPLGFCYFNNVAITAKWLKKHHNLERIAIVDWDIHHGNGTQDLTYDDPNILYISLHRFDNGTFFPGGGKVDECGSNNGLGKNVNIPWSGDLAPPMSDVEYLAAFRSVVMPILEDFRPQIILVSCGFDGAVGHPHPLGGYELTAMCFAYMTKKLMGLADGKVILVLEGGYELSSLAECVKLCVEALLCKELPTFNNETLRAIPNSNAVRTLKEVIHVQKKYWPTLKQYEPLISLSHDKAISVPISPYYINDSN
ncbi:unnamed protein product, partial [Didymodactylos carnosus]